MTADTLSRAHVDHRRLVFRVGEQSHEIDAGLVLEVVRVPHITRVPHGPDALAGIFNLRGKPVPVLSMSKVLNVSHGERQGTGKIVVYDHGGAIGLLVDDVGRLSAGSTATPLQGLEHLLDSAFKVTRRAPADPSIRSEVVTKLEPNGQLIAVLSFRVAGQLYGLPLDDIREVATLTGNIASIPNAAAGVIGLIPLRQNVLPLVSLAALLGLDEAHPVRESSRIVVIEHDGDLVGLVVDGMDVIQRLPEHAIDTVPPLLQRGRGDAQIEAIGRVSEGGLLISILSPEKLFGHHAVTQAIGQNTGARPMGTKYVSEEALEQFLIFQLGDENYGLPVGSVDEVVRVPSEVTRIPGAPAFVMGVLNLRGKVIPLIDQRSRFDAPIVAQAVKARAIIVRLGTLQAGFVVDGVSEVKAVSAAALSATPGFSSDRTAVFDRIADIESDGRMILLIDPQELLSRAERDIVAAITADKMAVTDP